MTAYTMTDQTRLQRDAIRLTADTLTQLTPGQQLQFTLRLAGLLATYWPASQGEDCLQAIADEATRCMGAA